MILITGESARFSVDIDISSEIDRASLEEKLQRIIETSQFQKLELDERRSYKKEGVPKAHYIFTYESSFNKHANSILLDILFHENEYPELSEIRIETNVLSTEEPYLIVKAPSENAILGDKMTAFAPNTTGVPYFNRKELEIVKQLFDVSRLIEVATDYSKVWESFIVIASTELEFRGFDLTPNDVLNDMIRTCLLITRRDKNKGEDLKKFNEIHAGLRRFTNFTIGSKFRIDQTIESAGKISWFATRMMNENFDQIVQFHSDMDISALEIKSADLSHLNKLKKSNKAAFWYWYNCINELTENEIEI